MRYVVARTDYFADKEKREIAMASSMNRVFLMGNVTRDPELRYISNGSAVTEIGLAINDRRKSSSGEWV